MPPLCPLATEERADPRLSCQSSGRVKVSTERVPAPPRLTYDYVKWESGQWRGPKHHRSITSHILLHRVVQSFQPPWSLEAQPDASDKCACGSDSGPPVRRQVSMWTVEEHQ